MTQTTTEKDKKRMEQTITLLIACQIAIYLFIYFVITGVIR